MTPLDAAILADLRAGRTYAAAARMRCVPVSHVQKVALAGGVRREADRARRNTAVIAALRAGKTIAEVRTEFSLGRDTAWRLARAAGVDGRSVRYGTRARKGARTS